MIFPLKEIFFELEAILSSLTISKSCILSTSIELVRLVTEVTEVIPEIGLVEIPTEDSAT